MFLDRISKIFLLLFVLIRLDSLTVIHYTVMFLWVCLQELEMNVKMYSFYRLTQVSKRKTNYSIVIELRQFSRFKVKLH